VSQHRYRVQLSATAGLGEASAIVSLIATATRLSKAVIEIGSTYKEARVQIELFGPEVGILGRILDQLSTLLLKDEPHLEDDAKILVREIVDECVFLFAQLDSFNERLYGRAGSAAMMATLKGKVKWVFEVAELEYLRARVDSMKINILLMMTLQSVHHRDRYYSILKTLILGLVRYHADLVNYKARKEVWTSRRGREACVQRLQNLESEVAKVERGNSVGAGNRLSVITADTAASTSSTWESIFRVYGWTKSTDTSARQSTTGVNGSEDHHIDILEVVEDYLAREDTPISLLAVGQETEDDQKRLKRLMEDRKKLSKEKLLSHYGVEGDLDFDALEKFLRRDENSPDPLAWMTSTISTAASAQVADRAALFKALNAPHLAQIKQKQRSRKNLMRYYDVTMTQV
jgi:hypothetical protein